MRISTYLLFAVFVVFSLVSQVPTASATYTCTNYPGSSYPDPACSFNCSVTQCSIVNVTPPGGPNNPNPTGGSNSNNVPNCVNCPVKTLDDVIGLISGIVSQMQVVFWIVAVGSALYAGFLYLRGGSNAETLKKAQKQILYTVIAIALGLMAFGIPRLVNDFLGLRG